MCPPVIAAMGIASAVIGGAGQIMSGIGQGQQYRYEASIADQNRRIADAQAQDSILNTNLEAQRLRRDQAQTAGQQQAAMGANGVDQNFGSAGDIQKDTAARGAEDAAQLYKGGNERTKGFEINAYNYASQAAADRAKASSAVMTGIFGGVSSALGAASQTFKKT